MIYGLVLFAIGVLGANYLISKRLFEVEERLSLISDKDMNLLIAQLHNDLAEKSTMIAALEKENERLKLSLEVKEMNICLERKER